ncbi:MAG: flagellar basal body rod protein FlgB [Bradymonadia bacterium]
MTILFDNLDRTLEAHLDYRLENQNLIAGNIANVDTPGYTPVTLKFERQLNEVLQGETPPEYAGGATAGSKMSWRGPAYPRADVEFDPRVLPDADGNSVDLDHEMAKLAENTLIYQAVTKAYTRRAAMMKYAILEGNG